jgi:GT2 family glycosyltransferase
VNKRIERDEANKGGVNGKKNYPKRDKTQYSGGMRFDIVVVLGMHRSGTSALAKALELFGVDLGNNLMAPQKDNPKGFFEDKQLVEINDRIFEKACSHWSSIQFLDPKFLSGPELSEERMSAGNWLNMKVAGGNHVGLKDPRLCRTLSFWEPLFTERRLRVGYIFSHRDPTQIGASLQKRNGFGLSYGVDLWAAYAADALFHIQGKSWIAVGFPQLLEEPRRELARIADFLETPWNPDREAVKEYEKEYLDTALWHHRTAERIPQQENCYQELSNALSILCVKKNNEAEKQAHDAAQVVFERAGKISNVLSENNRILFHQFAKQEKELEKIRKLLDERTAWAQALDKEVEKTRELFQEEQKLVEERTIWGKALDKELARSKETSSMALFQAEEAGKRAKLAEDQQIRLNYIGDCLDEIKKEASTQKAKNANVAKEMGNSLEEFKKELKQELDHQRKAQQEAVEKSVGGLKEELAQQRIAQQEEVAASIGGLKEELAHQRKAQQEAVEKSVVKVKKEIVAEIQSLIANLVEQAEKNRLALSARIDSAEEGMERRIVEVGEYAAKIRKAVVSPSSYLIPAPFSWYSYLYKMLNILEPVWLNKEKRSGHAPKRPGFWRRLERSIRKRRKRWINLIGFDREWYLKEYPDVARAGIDPLDHYIQLGIQEGRWKSKKDKQNRPNPHKKRALELLLLGELGKHIRKQLWLLWSYPRVKAQLKLSFRLLEKNLPFDPIWYQVKYPDVKGTSMSPFMHFIEYGAREGRLPNRRFSQECYLALAPEVASSGIPAPLHFLMQGWEEGRLTNWLDRYVEQSFDREIRERISGLLDLLLAEEDSEDLSGARERKISLLRNRLSLALRNRASPTEEPKVSIIIPVYNQLAYTLACVTSLYESDPSTTLEVIIADDCSNDGTREIFKEFAPWIKMVRTSRNLGFLRNCNHAAKTAKGEFIAFLNNDMVVLPGWLDSLVSTFVVDPECGMVGSKLLNLDGTLQEAGGIFWNDGSAWNYGRGQNPTSHEFNYKKEVDYCSGASICLRKEVWDAVDGFDEIYAPAYCEESDLAFRLRARGLKTIYQPRSVGVHLEGVSCGTDTAHGIKAYQVTNLEKFQNRWSDILKKEHFPNAEQVFLARDRSAKKRHMLFVDHYLPRPDFDAGSKQMATYLQLFVEMGFQISFWPDNLGYDKEYAHPLEELGIEVISCNGGLITFEQWIKKNGQHLDVAFLVRPYIALKYINGLKENSNASIVYYGVDIHFIRTKGELILNPTDQALIARVANEESVETECWEKADITLYPSFEECQYIREHFPTTKTDLLPLYCKSDEEISAAKTTTEFSKRSGILFVGGFAHSPNKDGILWFYNEILPLIREILPNLSLTIAGSNPPAEVRRLESKFIKVTGHVSGKQLSAFYENHRAAIAPLRFGGGVKGKVVESLLNGLPIVTTSIGSQGLCNPGKALSIGYSEQDFCEKVIALHQSENKWIEQRKSGIKYFEDNFSSRCIIPNLTKLLGNKKVNTSVKHFL